MEQEESVEGTDARDVTGEVSSSSSSSSPVKTRKRARSVGSDARASAAAAAAAKRKGRRERQSSPSVTPTDTPARTMINSEQKERLEERFMTDTRPGKDVCEELARELSGVSGGKSLNATQVSKWFENRRYKTEKVKVGSKSTMALKEGLPIVPSPSLPAKKGDDARAEEKRAEKYSLDEQPACGGQVLSVYVCERARVCACSCVQVICV